MAAARTHPRPVVPVVGSVVLHAGAVAALVLVARQAPPLARPPVYRVELIAAPPGPRAVGEVRPPDATPPAREAPAPRRAQRAPVEPSVPAPRTAPARRQPTRATENPSTTAPRDAANAPRAGGGPTGGTGAEPVSLSTPGIEFPFPGYLTNIVRQIAVRFKPSGNRPLRAEVAFLIQRDGRVTDFRFLTRSGVYAFDLEAQGAVEAVAAARAFGPLPDGFASDVLPVVFTFDPRVLR